MLEGKTPWKFQMSQKIAIQNIPIWGRRFFWNMVNFIQVEPKHRKLVDAYALHLWRKKYTAKKLHFEFLLDRNLNGILNLSFC